MKEIFFEIMKDVLEDRILYGYKADDTPDELEEVSDKEDSNEKV